MALSFFNPAAFWALLFAIPIIAVYLVRNRPSTRTVSTLLFWDQVDEEPGATSFLKRLRHPGSLLLQLVMLLLFTLALSDPKLNTKQIQATDHVVVIDNSASMRAIDSQGVSRFELAIAEAAAIIDGKSPSGKVSIVASCPAPKVVCAPTHSPTLAMSQLKLVGQTDCVGQLDNAIQFANSVARNSSQHSITAITDGNDSQKTLSPTATDGQNNQPATEGLTSRLDAIEVTTIVVGKPVQNVGLTQFRVRRASTDPTLWHLLYEVSNFTNSSIEANIEIHRNDVLIDVLPVNLKPNESKRDVLTKTSTEGGLVTGTLKTADGDAKWKDALATDDQATSQLSERPVIDVTLVTSGNWFLQQALNANPLVRLSVVSDTTSVKAVDGQVPIVVFDSIVPPSWPPADSQATTKALVVAPTNSCRLWKVNGQIEATFVGDYQKTHPLLEYLQLEDIAINAASDVILTDKVNTIVSSLEGQPLLATYEAGNTKVLMLAVQLGRSDLPLRSSFPILLTNALNWLTESSPQLLPQADTKAPITVAVQRQSSRKLASSTSDTTTWYVETPDRQSQAVAVVDGAANLGQLTQVGVHALRASSTVSASADSTPTTQDSILLPCNLVSRQESRLNQQPKTLDDRNLTSVTTIQRHWDLQQILLVLVMLIVIAECWLWHRRVVE